MHEDAIKDVNLSHEGGQGKKITSGQRARRVGRNKKEMKKTTGAAVRTLQLAVNNSKEKAVNTKKNLPKRRER